MSKTVLVTGVSKGIGRAIVEQLLNSDEKVKVIGIARSLNDLKEMQIKLGPRFEYLCADVTDEQAVSDFLTSKASVVDAIIANAGTLSPVQSVNEADISQWKRLFDINFFSVVSLVTRLLPQLRKSSQGDVILVSSGASVKPYYAWGAYGASKAALNHFATTLASEEANVQAVAIAPGVVDTQMQTEIRDSLGPANMTREALKRFTDLHEKGELLSPKVPATIYANLALKGIRAEINGKYLRYNDAQLTEYS
ncbi:LAME_0E00298g1_1 [Lachancea meyersii CBS 8951]|uniref:LAME_0E00298g1_1 n=1 Tax=Lachancea meyersii CBS 8951 TaxID=1266667 RepID=A0A1G4JEC2_9SACH|nr:LAME_0E00298g1_1 [Lachancea meyersii CBS 8951]